MKWSWAYKLYRCIILEIGRIVAMVRCISRLAIIKCLNKASKIHWWLFVSQLVQQLLDLFYIDFELPKQKQFLMYLNFLII